MPVQVSYPGVYIEEVPSGVHTITGVATSITAFVGRAWKGPVDKAEEIFSFSDFQRKYGGLWEKSAMSYAVQQFFLNGGTQAIIVRVAKSAKIGKLSLTGSHEISAANEGTWAKNITISIDHKVNDDAGSKAFNLYVKDTNFKKKDEIKADDKRNGSGQTETFLNLSVDSSSPRYVVKILEEQSQLVRWTKVGAAKPGEVAFDSKYLTTNASDGSDIGTTEVVGTSNDKKTGMYALRDVDLFNILCLPPLTLGDSPTEIDTTTFAKASALCEEKRAFLIVDIPFAKNPSNAGSYTETTYGTLERKNAAVFFPWVKYSDPLKENMAQLFAPCGTIAGLMSRIDASRGVWKAPAGIEANLRGVIGLGHVMTDMENGSLNPKGVNCLRSFRGIGTVCWGARTLMGNDILASEWKYIPIRRLALFLEESLFRGTKWVVFEPNDEPLWAKIRMNVGAFMMRLFKQGAFQGGSPDKAFYVKCDGETTPQSDRDLGIVNIEVGFAPLKPAEFVIIKIQQIAGEL